MAKIKVRLKENSPYSEYGYYRRGDIGYLDGYTNGLAVIILENGEFAKANLDWINVVDEDDSSNTEKDVQKPAEWSEEDEEIINGLINSLTRISLNTRTDSTSPNYSFYKEIDWLKSLRPHKQDVMSVDEFRHIVGYLVQDIVANEHMPEEEKQPTKFFVEKYYNKLRPQSHWKPSDEQMKQLGWVAEQNKDNMIGKELMTLYNDLKKL